MDQELKNSWAAWLLVMKGLLEQGTALQKRTLAALEEMDRVMGGREPTDEEADEYNALWESHSTIQEELDYLQGSVANLRDALR